MVFSWTRIKKSFFHIPPLLQRFAGPLVLMHLINILFNQTMIYLQEIRMEEKSDNFIPQMFAVAFVGFLFQSLTKVIATLLICYHFHHQTPLLKFLKTHTELGLIESLRAFFKSILWGFLFIVPGLVKMIRYQFIIYFVASSPQYKAGEIDALEGSEKITKGHFFSLTILVLLLASFAFSLNSTQLFFDAPVEIFMTEFIGFFFICFQGIYMLFLFQDLLRAQEQK